MKSVALLRPSFAVLALLSLAGPSRADTIKVPADFPTIQEAVNAAADGDIVIVSKGTYPENVTIVTANVALRGKSATIDGRYAGDCVNVQAAGVEVSGFKLVNGGAPALAATGDGAPPQFGGLHVIGTGAVISKLEVVACNNFGILLEGTGLVDKCTVDGCVGAGIVVTTGDILGSVVTNVTKNHVTRCQDGIVLNDGPFLVEKSVCDDNRDDGIVLNLFVLVADGELAQASQVTKNECHRNGGNGLDLFKAVGPTLTVDKSVLQENGTGLTAGGSDVDVTNSTIEDNRFGGAILLTTDSQFLDNKVRDNGELGVFVFTNVAATADGGNPVGNNTVRGNTVQDNGGDGIFVLSDGNTVDDNVIKENLGDGVQVGPGPTGNAVTANAVTANGHDGIDNSGLLTLISDNTTKSNGGADLAGAGQGPGTTAEGSAGNVSGDGSGLLTEQELELLTFD